MLSEDQIKEMIDDNLVREHRYRSLSPEHPFIRGSSQNPDIFFQAREASNPYYSGTVSVVEQTMSDFERLSGRSYRLFQYCGDLEAERVIIIMGSAAQTVEEVVEQLNLKNERVGVLKVRLYRPFSGSHLLRALPSTVKAIAVLDRTKEPGSAGEPLYCDVVASINEAAGSQEFPWVRIPKIAGGRYGLSSKDSPTHGHLHFTCLHKNCMPNHFTIGIEDDVSFKSLPIEKAIIQSPGAG